MATTLRPTASYSYRIPDAPSRTASVINHPVQPMDKFARQPRRRSSSHVERWLEDQNVFQVTVTPHGTTAVMTKPASTPSGCDPYLAYPHLRAPRAPSEHSQPVVDISASQHRDALEPPLTLRAGNPISLPSTPTKPGRRSKQGISSDALFNTPPSVRHGTIKQSHSRKPSGAASAATRSRSPSHSSSHQPSYQPLTSGTITSLGQATQGSQTVLRRRPSDVTRTSQVSSGWKFRRPSVLGHFQSPSQGQVDEHPSTPPRPSTSSSVTHSSGMATCALLSGDGTRTSSSRDSPRTTGSYSSGTLFRSSPSLWSLPTDATHMNDPPNSMNVVARELAEEKTRFLRSPSAKTNSGSSKLASMLSSPRKKKKRKLIISGVPFGDPRRFEGVRKWCESFGEVNQITRIANGDLHVDFKSSEVADTVCRINARVYINGVGSVALSWFTGKRP